MVTIGARRLDEKEGTTRRIDNLRVARSMLKAGKDAKTIWRATGWQKGVEGKWRWEMPDGKFIKRFRNFPELNAEYEAGLPINSFV